MSRIVHRKFDDERTEYLGLEDIRVEKGVGRDDYYSIWDRSNDPVRCPFCGSLEAKTHDLFTRDYKDLLIVGGVAKPVILTYNFYKYRCLNPECRKIFSREIHFATERDNLTYRFENEIARLIIDGYSYQDVAYHFPKAISRQAVGQVFNRWVKRLEEQRKIDTYPKTLAIISGETEYTSYTLFINVSDQIRIFDVKYGVSSDEIASFLRNNGFEGVETVLTNCNPTIYDVVIDCLPDSLYVIPVQYWFDLVTKDFKEFAHEEMRWVPVADKDNVIVHSEDELKIKYQIGVRDQILTSRPQLKRPYADYHELRGLVESKDIVWTYNGITDWIISIKPPLKDRLKESELILNAYKEEIYQHELHKDSVPDRLVFYTDQLEELLHEFRTFSEEVLKARVLYSVPSDLNHWQGVPIKEVIDKLTEIIDKKNERKNYE